MWNLVWFSHCIERDDSEVEIVAVLKSFDFILFVGVSICFFSTILKMQKKLYLVEAVWILYHCFCGVFVFLTGTSSGWSCSFDGTPFNDVHTAWSKANKSLCTCFWNSGEWCSLILLTLKLQPWQTHPNASWKAAGVFLYVKSEGFLT